MEVNKIYSEAEFIEWVTEVMSEHIKEVYNLEFNIPVELSGRLGTTWGYFGVKRVPYDVIVDGEIIKEGEAYPGTKVIRFSRDLLTATNRENVEDLARHEATHYALFELGKPYLDEDEYFQEELKRYGIVSKSFSLEDLGVQRKTYVWICTECREVVITGGKTKKDYSEGYQSKCCGAKLEDKGWRVISSVNEKIYD